jgi:pyruvate/2-oxoglutarate dehydrogenase complex dihydrolipoamide dehydrogenase (E3) component
LFKLAREHNWSKMIESIQTYIRSLNFKYRTDLRSKKVVYENSYGQFVSPHRLKVFISSFVTLKNIFPFS